uniref:DUF4178 domain-containing protein n=1 Tax=Roseihalotalea indica TaxID=2867963 RepID=A0AA49JHM3_9BACT|nr:DUF4178 domain-containing protein [Tunicatimonas sp. TK19036]
MTAVLIFSLVLIGIAVYFWQKNKNNKKIDPAQDASSKELHLENVRAGGLIHLMNVGPMMEEYDVNILSRSVYRAGQNDEWYELEGETANGKVWITLEYDDGLDVTLATRKLKLRDISINRSDLDTMDEEGEGEFTFEGKTFYYEVSSEASYFRDSQVSPDNEEFFYYWEFETDEGDEFITIEEWESGRFEVTLSSPIKESQVKIYSLGQ